MVRSGRDLRQNDPGTLGDIWYLQGQALGPLPEDLSSQKCEGAVIPPSTQNGGCLCNRAGVRAIFELQGRALPKWKEESQPKVHTKFQKDSSNGPRAIPDQSICFSKVSLGQNWS